jgi:hypothetical protein
MLISRQLTRILTIALALSLSTAAHAVPVACPGDECSVSDGPAVLYSDSGGNLSGLDINGIPQLNEKSLFLTLGVNSAVNPVTETLLSDVVPLTSATQDEDTNQIVLEFSDADLRFTVTYTLSGMGLTATVGYLVVIDNLTNAAADLALVDFVDYDLMDDSSDDTAQFSAPATITQTGKGAIATFVSTSPIAFHDVGACCATEMFNRLVMGHLSDDDGPVGPEDVAGGFQDNRTVPGLGSSTIVRQLQVNAARADTVAPAPGLTPAGLAAALALLGAVGWRAMRRRA